MRSKQVLYVEDDQHEVSGLEKAFRAERAQDWLHVVRGEVEAIAWLAGDGEYEDRVKYPMPQLVLVDLAVPQGDGMAVLTWIREQPALAALLVVALGGSSCPEDEIEEAYRRGANALLEKPSGQKGLREIARLLRLWLRHSLPRPEPTKYWDAPASGGVSAEEVLVGRDRFPLHKPQGYGTWVEGR